MLFFLSILAVLLMLTGVQPLPGIGLVLLIILAAIDQNLPKRR